MSFREHKKTIDQFLRNKNEDELISYLSDCQDSDKRRAAVSVLFEAVDYETADVKYVKLLVDLIDYDLNKIVEGSTLLQSAIRNGDVLVTKALLELGANPNTNCAILSVSYSGSQAKQIEIVDLLVEYGVDLNQSPEQMPGLTALVKAIDGQLPDLAKHLRSRGATLPIWLGEAETPELDLGTFQSRLVTACRKCWLAANEKLPDETFCMFGLETDSNFHLVRPLFDSEQAILRDEKNRLSGGSFVTRVSLDSDAEFHGLCESHLDELSGELNSMLGVEESIRKRASRIRKLAKIFEATLKELDREKLFGSGAARERIVLLVSIIDADENEWKQMLKIVKRLNPKTVFDAFAAKIE